VMSLHTTSLCRMQEDDRGKFYSLSLFKMRSISCSSPRTRTSIASAPERSLCSPLSLLLFSKAFLAPAMVYPSS